MTAGCGLGWVDNHSGGAEHLPTSGVGPYTKLLLDLESPANEPYVVTIFQANLVDPSALRRADGGYRLWFGNESITTPPTSEIWMAELARLDDLPEFGPERVLAPDQAWEGTRVGSPCVIEVDSLSRSQNNRLDRSADNELVMFYQAGSDIASIGRAYSDNGGKTWVKHPGNPVLEGFGSPAVAKLPDGSWLLYATRPDRPGIFRARSEDGLSWQADENPVIAPRPNLPDAFDRNAVFNPWLVITRTVTGNLHYGLFFDGLDQAGEDGVHAIGWAGSFDGLDWQRYANPDGPVLEAGPPSEQGPAVLLEPDRGVMFFSQRLQGTQSIAAAMHP